MNSASGCTDGFGLDLQLQVDFGAAGKLWRGSWLNTYAPADIVVRLIRLSVRSNL